MLSFDRNQSKRLYYIPSEKIFVIKIAIWIGYRNILKMIQNLKNIYGISIFDKISTMSDLYNFYIAYYWWF